jgi:hypothetical protein
MLSGKVQTVAELRNVLNTDCQLPSSEDYEPAKHFDIEWAYNVLRQLYVFMSILAPWPVCGPLWLMSQFVTHGIPGKTLEGASS